MVTKAGRSPEDLKKLYWHSRRGMLELDLLLVPFAENCLAGLSDEQLQLYRELLEEEDQDLYSWLTRREQASDPGLQRIIELVLAAARQSS